MISLVVVILLILGPVLRIVLMYAYTVLMRNKLPYFNSMVLRSFQNLLVYYIFNVEGFLTCKSVICIFQPQRQAFLFVFWGECVFQKCGLLDSGAGVKIREGV